MLEIVYLNQFKKEFEISKKRGKDIEKIKTILNLLVKKQNLPPKYKNHKLQGNYKDHWECHIEPNWLLIYRKTKTELILVRIGSHADLF